MNLGRAPGEASVVGHHRDQQQRRGEQERQRCMAAKSGGVGGRAGHPRVDRGMRKAPGGQVDRKSLGRALPARISSSPSAHQESITCQHLAPEGGSDS